MIWRYTDLNVQVDANPEGKGYRVRASIPGRVEWSTFEEPFSEEELEALRNAIVEGNTRNFHIVELGRRLFERVFTGPVRDLLKDSMPKEGTRSKLRLRLRPAPEVWHWPWEILHSPDEFLALSTKTLVVRQSETPKTFRIPRAPHPLRVLVVISGPSELKPLDGEKEWKEIVGALSLLQRLGIVQVERLLPPTLEKLFDCLAKKRFHVLHFIGHCRFRTEGGGGELIFEDADRRAVFVDGGSLASVLDGHDSLRLVVLNACEGARGTHDPFSSVAKSLHRKSIPAVVAMQYPIDDAMAVLFTRRFYAALARGQAVDRAMTWARKGMRVAGAGLDWAIPVLLLLARDGRIFRWRPSWGFVLSILLVLSLRFLAYPQWHGIVTTPEPKAADLPVRTYCPSPRNVEMELVRIRPATFLMGSEDGEDNEKPVHEVTISKPFCLGKFEVTQKQWEKVMGANSVESRYKGDDLPITLVTYEEAQQFVRELNKLEGTDGKFRLATEAEWELGAGTGGGFNCLHDHKGLLRVGSLEPNSLGVHDMLGNAWEWVQDWDGAYSEASVTDPTGPPSGTKHVKRGGSFNSDKKHCRPSRRHSEAPDRRWNDLGFRIVRELNPPPISAAGSP